MKENVQFGLVLEHCFPAAMPPEFSVLRVTAALAEQPDFQAGYRQLKSPPLEIDQPADRTICRLAPESNLRLKLDFLEQFKLQCRRAVALGADRITAAFDLERALSEPEYREKLKELLLGCCGVLHALPLRLLLKIRLPLPPAVDRLSSYDDLIRELPGGKLGFTADLHPHEPAFAALPGDFTRPLDFVLDDLNFVYEPATGNRLTLKAIRPPLDFFRSRVRPGRVFFEPAGIEAEALAAEAAELAALIKEASKNN